LSKTINAKLCVRSGGAFHDNAGEMSSWPLQLLYVFGIVSPVKLLLLNSREGTAC
jgi:hypothetical protein